MRRVVTAALTAALVAAASGTSRAASAVDPRLRFRALPTAHFVIYFHQDEDALAQRLAAIAEETWTIVGGRLGTQAPRRTHVVLVDQTEVANGFATPQPYDTIFIFTTWPRGEEFYTDDWLRLAFTHEFTHIVHLDRSESWARIVRGVFGRTLLAFPNQLLPTWQIEGLATYEESAVTGEGRLHAADFRAIVDEAARHRALEPLDRVNGGLTDWPAGAAPYAYGVGFHQYLVDRFGAEALGRLAAATAGRVPYTASRVFENVFGEPLGTLWADYESTLAASAGPPALDAGIMRLTRQGFEARAPRFDRFTCRGCRPEIVYASVSPNDFPSLNSLRLDGSPPKRLARRYRGTTTAVGREAVYFDQLEIRRNVGVYGDLFERSRASGRVRQLTFEARLTDPDLSPDETAIACVQQRPGHRDLVLVRLKPDAASARIEMLVSEPDTQFNSPRWAPDGRSIAVERHRLGSLPEIVVVDIAARSVRVVAARPKTRILMPAWRPDGRAIVAAAADEERPFNLFEFQASGDGQVRQLTHVSGGALWPEISPDGRTIVFVGYTPDGFDIFSMPYPSTNDVEPNVVSAFRRTDDVVRRTDAERTEPPSTRYSPLPTLPPTSWFPLVEGDSAQLRIGAAVAGQDVLAYHAYAASATWLASSPADAPTPGAANPDWSISYAYNRWRPVFFASASRSTSFFAGPAAANGTPAAATELERVVEAGVALPFVHARVVHQSVFSLVRAVDEITLPDRTISRDRTAIRLGWQSATSHTYGYSISREQGVVAGGTAEFVERPLGSSATSTTLTADVRGYAPGLAPHHVVAARLAAGVSSGDATVGRTFLLGGPIVGDSAIDFGSRAVGLLRGFPSNSFAGTHSAVLNLDYRWPIARPQRGIGTWPIFLHTVHAAVFADAGHAWTRTFDAGAIKTSLGAELSTNVVAGYYFPFTATAGAAWGRDGSGTRPDRVTAYLRVGRAF
jgi:WD40 repeat protein